MTQNPDNHKIPQLEITRRSFLRTSLLGGALAVSGFSLWDWLRKPTLHAQTFIGSAPSYSVDLGTIIGQGFQSLGVTASEIKGKRILLKPNLVETLEGAEHINTHPSVIHGAIEAFLRLGAQEVYVAEGPGHRRDTLDILEESGMAQILHENRIQFFDLNNMNGFTQKNVGGRTSLATLTFPSLFQEIDWIVSVAKLKTHHWAGVTLSMKNLFGAMPGLYYGWPKNVLHHAGINQSIVDISATLRPHFAIIDGILGMEGDGPIMGDPIHSGVLVMGRNLPAVDATSARLMGINPHKIEYLDAVSNWLGPIRETHIQQVGESISSHTNPFALLDTVPAHQGIRLS
jgi:uncharacterized protein (DUF362 family)